MVCALKRIAVEVHNVAVHGRDLMRISSLFGLDYTTYTHHIGLLTINYMMCICVYRPYWVNIYLTPTL